MVLLWEGLQICCKIMEGLLSGIYTVEDDELFILLSALINQEQIHVNCIWRKKTVRIYKECYSYCLGNRWKFGSKRNHDQVLSKRNCAP